MDIIVVELLELYRETAVNKRGNTMTNKENSAKAKFWKLFLWTPKTKSWKLFLWIAATLFLILLVGFIAIRIYLATQDGSGGTFQLIGLSKELMIAMATCLAVVILAIIFLSSLYNVISTG